jgi:hypothetical protein
MTGPAWWQLVGWLDTFTALGGLVQRWHLALAPSHSRTHFSLHPHFFLVLFYYFISLSLHLSLFFIIYQNGRR